MSLFFGSVNFKSDRYENDQIKVVLINIYRSNNNWEGLCQKFGETPVISHRQDICVMFALFKAVDAIDMTVIGLPQSEQEKKSFLENWETV